MSDVVREAKRVFRREYRKEGFADEAEARADKRLQRLARELGEARNARERREAQERYERARREDEGQGRERTVKPFEDEAVSNAGSKDPDDYLQADDDSDSDEEDD